MFHKVKWASREFTSFILVCLSLKTTQMRLSLISFCCISLKSLRPKQSFIETNMLLPWTRATGWELFGERTAVSLKDLWKVGLCFSFVALYYMKRNLKYSVKPKGEDVEKLHIAMQKAPDLYFLVCMSLFSTLLHKEVVYMLCMVTQAAQQTSVC